MKKFMVIALMAAMFAFAGNAFATDGDFEMSGHINTGFGYQYNSHQAAAYLGGAFFQEGMVQAAGTGGTDNNVLVMYVGDVELDIAKTFGENIRLRTDIDFGRAASNSYAYAVANFIEQAYATVNIPVGYGLEFLVGRFNAPMGFEAVDNNDNDIPFHTAIFNFLRPQNLTGVKFYYPFSDLVDLHFWLANNLQDAGATAGANIPAFGTRLGFTWGMEGQESTVGVGGAMSAESQQVGKKWGDWSWLADLDFNIWVNDVFAIGGEGLYRMDNSLKATPKDNTYYAGLLNLHYVFSDVWDGTLRYTFALDKNGSGTAAAGLDGGNGNATLNGVAGAFGGQYKVTGATASALGLNGYSNSIDLGINYHVTDGAKIMMVYQFDYIIPDAAGLKKGMASTVAANFAYDF